MSIPQLHPSGLRVTQVGSTLLVAIILLTALSFIAAHVCFKMTERYRYGMQTNGWQEAALAAEAGADMAMMALNNGSWTGWKNASGGNVFAPPTVISTNSYQTTISHTTGEGGARLAAIVTVDAPPNLVDVSGRWYRIRSTGVAEVAGTMRLGFEPTLLDIDGKKQPHADLLRKFSLSVDKSGGQLKLPQATRTIEIIAKPGTPSPYRAAITLQRQLTMGGSTLIDGFNSSDPAYSTDGFYDAAKRASTGTVNIIDTMGLTNLKNSPIYGNLAYNGVAPLGTSNVRGTISSPSSATTTPVPRPVWTTFSPTPTTVTTTTTLVSGAGDIRQRYKLNTIDLPSNGTVTLKNPTPGQDSYVEIWVVGDLALKGKIKQEPGVHVTYYVEGNISFGGSSFDNQSGLAANNLVYGVTPASGTKTVQVSGSGSFIGVLNAPAYDFTVSGSGDFYGALIGNTMSLGGGGSVHYDAALLQVGGPANGANVYRVASWIEDIR